MFQSLGPTELIVILLIVIVLFGVGRISKLGQEFGGAIGAFRREVRKAGDEKPLNDKA
jgi:sec-independent protein translocase protein TatA